MVKETQIDPKMDMTKDMDFLKGSRGISYFFTTLSDIPRDLFKKYVRGKNFLDIGCGDGRILRLAMICGAKKYRGIEIDEKFIRSSNMQRYIRKGDFLDIDFNIYDVLYYFLGSDLKSGADLLKKLKEFNGVFILYYRKVPHHLQDFHDNLINVGFKELDHEKYIRIYGK